MSHHVLVVEDDELVRSGLAVNLERDGYRVSTAANGDEALAVLARENVDLVLTDMVMDGVDGLELIRRLSARMPDLPVIVLTGHGTAANAVEAMRNGAADYIQKPAHPDEISQRIRNVLDTRDLRRRLARERSRVQAQYTERDRRTLRRQRQKAIEGFAAGLTAELKGLLAPLAAAAAAGAISGPSAAAVRNLQEIADALAALNGHPPATPQPCDLNRVITNYLESERFLTLRDRLPGLRVETRLGSLLPPAQGCPNEGPELLADLFELIARVAAEPVLVLSTRVERMAGAAEGDQHFSVLGIQFAATVSAEDLDRLFEPYYAERVLGWRPGSRLLLPRLAAIADRCGGFVEGRLIRERRVEICLCLPVSVGHAEDALRARGSEHILVVDDGEEARNEARRMLEQLGYTVTVVENGREALAWAEERARQGKPPPDLMLIDLVLGDVIDGVETFRRARAANPRQKVLLMGGFVETGRVTEALEEGVLRYLRKPLLPDELGRAVREALDQDT